MIKPKRTSRVPRPKSPLRPSQRNKELLEKCLAIVKTSNEELNPKQMKEALQKIAEEVQRFHRADTSDDLSADDSTYKSKLLVKNKQIKSLRENLNTACLVAKTLTSSNEKECSDLSKNLSMAKNDTVVLQKKIVENNDIIEKLNTEKQALTTKFQNLKKFIELGYKELQRLRKGEENKDLPIELQLKEIIVSCGQYYADYCNEHEKCSQLEQKNRFLTNKLSILERNLEATTADLKLHQNVMRGVPSEKRSRINDYTIGYVRSEYKLGQEVNVARVHIEPTNFLENYKPGPTPRAHTSIDLSRHMELVNDLLKDQDSMLSELKQLSEDLGCLDT